MTTFFCTCGGPPFEAGSAKTKCPHCRRDGDKDGCIFVYWDEKSRIAHVESVREGKAAYARQLAEERRRREGYENPPPSTNSRPQSNGCCLIQIVKFFVGLFLLLLLLAIGSAIANTCSSIGGEDGIGWNPASRCGDPDYTPSGRSESEWKEFECKKGNTSICYTREEYSNIPGTGCPGKQLCCPP